MAGSSYGEGKQSDEPRLDFAVYSSAVPMLTQHLLNGEDNRIATSHIGGTSIEEDSLTSPQTHRQSKTAENVKCRDELSVRHPHMWMCTGEAVREGSPEEVTPAGRTRHLRKHASLHLQTPWGKG